MARIKSVPKKLVLFPKRKYKVQKIVCDPSTRFQTTPFGSQLLRRRILRLTKFDALPRSNCLEHFMLENGISLIEWWLFIEWFIFKCKGAVLLKTVRYMKEMDHHALPDMGYTERLFVYRWLWRNRLPTFKYERFIQTRAMDYIKNLYMK